MKPIFAKVVETVGQEIFAVRITERKTFSTEFHFHKECQMTYIVKSKGKRMIGDNIANFDNDELTFLGSDLPHVWHNDTTDLTEENEHQAYSIALFFDPQRLVQHLSVFFDTTKLTQFLTQARRGIIFHGASKEKIKTILQQMVEATGMQKTVLLFHLINELTETREITFLSGTSYTNNYIPKDMQRIDKVFQYVLENYGTAISLEKVASLMSLSKHAFCRYFKSRTQKTFIQFVNEVRIMHACEMIQENNDQINNIAYSCGFNSLSNFNKIFKSLKQKTPSQYKQDIISNLHQ
ncbi:MULTISPECIES: helix-turn-helix domain-containing protein [Sphingobacterium]|uniref:helix-turn-helix domain-containing protein n=1 Tax=Sphingobacterium TaxID=28453 RepID=UPI0013D97B94|nr:MULTISPECIES: AraC family transcriptional regulator [unclassified Sphingobacterium]